MSFLDIKTLFVSNAFTCIALGLVLLFYYSSRKTYPGFLYFMLSSFVFSVGYSSVLMKGFNIPEILQIFLINFAFSCGALLRLIGIGRFIGASYFYRIFLGLMIATVGSCLYFSGGKDFLMLRNFFLSTFISSVIFYIAFLLFRKANEKRNTLYKIIAMSYCLQGLFLMLRAVFWFFQADIGLFDSSVIHSTFLLACLWLEITLVLGFIMMNAERLEIDLLNSEKKQIETVKLLEQALLEIKVLGGLLPICASCKMIRDDKGYWNQLESFIKENSEAEFSHSICPNCAEKLYPEDLD